MDEHRKVRCPYCNLLIEEGSIKCPSCGYVIVPEQKEEKSEKAFDTWKTLEEMYKKYGKGEKKIDEETVRAWEALEEIAKKKSKEKSAAQQPSIKESTPGKQEPRKWEALEKEIKKAPPRPQVVQRETQHVSALRNLMKTDGLSTRKYDKKRRFEIERKVHKKLFLIPIIFAIILISSVLGFMYHIITEKKVRINIDGEFSDWDDVNKFEFREQQASINPNINITSAAIWENEKAVYIYIHVEGSALYGNNINRTDQFVVFFDIDTSADTGYLVGGIGADACIEITGISNRVLNTAVMEYHAGSAYPHDNWNGWMYKAGAACAVHGSEIELSVAKSILPYKNAPVHIVSIGFDGTYDATDYPIVSGNAILLTEIFEMPGIITSSEVKVETAYLRVIGNPCVESIMVETTSSLVTASVEFKGSRTILRFENNIFMAKLENRFSDGDHFSIYANTGSVANGDLLSLSVLSITMDNGYFWKKSIGENRKAYVRSVPATLVKVDGAFGDWENMSMETDDMDCINAHIDVRQFARYANPADEMFFYMRLSDAALSGTLVPARTPDYSGMSIAQDTDRDTVPDNLDPMPYDFNNDGVADGETQNDVDGDEIKDYPYGNDYWLNTTIPNDSRFPQEFRGKFVSVYIGPGAQADEIAGMDFIRLYVDTDANSSTGLYMNPNMGAELMLEITGRSMRVLSSELYDWHGKWEKAGTFPAENFNRQIEFGGIKLSDIERARFYIQCSDWYGNADEMSPKMLRNMETPETRVFDTNVRVNSNPTGWQLWPDMAYDSDGVIYAVWESNETGTNAIYFSKSDDGGITWSTATRIPSSGDGARPAIAVYKSGTSTYIHIVFTGDELGGGGWYPDLYYARSTDGGNTFTTTVLDSDYSSGNPDICVDAMGYVYVVYTNYFLGFDADVKLRVSTNMGASFGSAINIASTGYSEYLPAVAVQGSGASSTLHIAYTYAHDNESGNERYDTDVLYKKVTNAGSSPVVGSAVGVATYVNRSEYVLPNSIACDALGNVHIVYTFNWTYDNYDVYYARSTDGGASFTTTNLVGTSYDEYQPRIAIDANNNPHIVWQDNRSGNYDIWYTNSSNNGVSFLPYSGHIKINKDATTQSQACATILFVNAENARKELCVAWADRRSGDYDIYFANGTNIVYLQVNSAYGTPAGTGWYNAGTTAIASVNGIVYDSPSVRHVCTGFIGTGSAPPSGNSNSTAFQIYKPSGVTFGWLTQYYCQITFTGTDAQHTVNGSYTENSTTHSIAGLVGSWAGWCDENTVLYFHDFTSPQQNHTTDVHSWVVTSPIVATIHYSAPSDEVSGHALVVIVLVAITVLLYHSEKTKRRRNITTYTRHTQPDRNEDYCEAVHSP